MPFNGVSQASSRDARLLAGTAVAMLLTTPSDSQCAESAAWSLLQINNTGKLQHLIARKGILPCAKRLLNAKTLVHSNYDFKMFLKEVCYLSKI